MKSLVFSIITCISLTSSIVAQTWNKVGSPGLEYPGDYAEVDNIYNYNNKLFVSGSFTKADGLYVPTVAKWNGIAWDSLYTAAFDYVGNKYSLFNGSLVLGGYFHLKGVAGTGKDELGWSDGSNITVCNTCNITSGSFKTMVEYQGNFYVGGNFINIGGVAVNRIAKWNGSSWSGVGGGVTNGFMPSVQTMAVFNNELYVGGDLTKMGTVNTNNIARWNGTNWSSLKAGLNNYATGMVVDSINNFLYVTGAFNMADGKKVNWISGWDGQNWFVLDTMLSGNAYAMTMYHNELHIAGEFSVTGPSGPIRYLAKWDGKKWTSITGIPSTLLSIGVYNDELYIGGAFSQINGDTSINAIARYYSPPPTGCDYLQARIFASDTVYYYSGDSSLVQFENNNKYASSWKWSFADGDTDIVQNPVHYYTTPGIYTAQVIVNYNGCIDTATRVVFVKDITGINELKKNNLFKVFPNPSKDEITVRIEACTKLPEPRIEIFDMQGRKVKEILEMKGNEVKISLMGFRKGVYIVKLNGQKGKEYSLEKIIVQ